MVFVKSLHVSIVGVSFTLLIMGYTDGLAEVKITPRAEDVTPLVELVDCSLTINKALDLLPSKPGTHL